MKSMIRRNPWKVAFFTVIFLIVLVMTMLIILLSNVKTGDSIQPPTMLNQLDGPEFIITTRKRDVNLWLEREISKEQTGMENQYKLFLGDYVYFQSEFKVLGFTVPLEMTLNPIVTTNGNIELVEESFTIGNMALSSSKIFELINHIPNFPDWIYVLPEERKIFLDLREGISEDIQLEVKELDLSEDKIKVLLRMIE